MELYGQKSKSIPQKLTIIMLEIILLWLSYWILFQHGGNWFAQKLHFENHFAESRRLVIFIFSIIVFLRIGFMMFFLLKRKIPWEESISIPFAFALYYIGFPLLVLPTKLPVDIIDILGILVFFSGSFTNTFAELQRHFWKQQPENKGRLYTKGLFSYAMHINYFGDLLWVSAYAILTRNWWSVSIPLFLFCFFVFYNIPKLDQYLKEKYKDDFPAFARRTKKLIPFVY